jgi:hypothetical protein
MGTPLSADASPVQSFNVCMVFQVIWVCILCRKKQELLIKTGTWMHRSTDLSDDPIMRRIEQVKLFRFGTSDLNWITDYAECVTDLD